ncbi:hypothetical protein E2C01_051798 [Portunus trituberculatus]|uniref:Uncharacterized protein n=1 Tax=Portunus trituberculatus TaxID=210409 RepID=A0A5B7GBZ4_PORTR|nr:hypothetical protein [Portunus trituberculatus]
MESQPSEPLPAKCKITARECHRPGSPFLGARHHWIRGANFILDWDPKVDVCAKMSSVLSRLKIWAGKLEEKEERGFLGA